MGKADFANWLFYVPCEQRPIKIFCKCSKAQACHTVASEYYNTIISSKGVFVWPAIETE